VTNPKTLFFIDDDNDDLELFCEAVNLIDQNIICIPSDNSEAVLHSLKRNDTLLPDLIFLDLNMPRVDGREFLSEIKKLSAYSHIPVIIFSTSYHKRDIDETKKLGASYFITKPSSMKELVERLNYIFSVDWYGHKW
jgi:DNA-binding response OmpR family regulator